MMIRTHKSVRRLARSPLLAAALAALSAIGLAQPSWAQAAPPAGCGGPDSATWINISMEGVRSGDGLMAITVYPDNSRRFLVKNGSLYVVRVPAHAGTTHACVFVPNPGVYAIAVYHDADANRKLNRTGIGFPAEGYGFSNNPTTLAGLPAFRSVRLNIARTGLSSRITMKYP